MAVSYLLMAFLEVLGQVGQERIAAVHLFQELTVFFVLEVDESLLIAIEDILDVLDQNILGLSQLPPFFSDLHTFLLTLP